MKKCEVSWKYCGIAWRVKAALSSLRSLASLRYKGSLKYGPHD
jgi:hypothetical protein